MSNGQYNPEFWSKNLKGYNQIVHRLEHLSVEGHNLTPEQIKYEHSVIQKIIDAEPREEVRGDLVMMVIKRTGGLFV